MTAINTPIERITAQTVARIFEALFKGLDDYTADQRGDVGSWIRMACVRGVSSLLLSLLDSSTTAEWIDQAVYHRAVGRILKLAAERLDVVRKVAGEALKPIVMRNEARPEWQLPASSELRRFYEGFVCFPSSLLLSW